MVFLPGRITCLKVIVGADRHQGRVRSATGLWSWRKPARRIMAENRLPDGSDGELQAAKRDRPGWSNSVKLLARWAPLIILAVGGVTIAVLGLFEYLSLSAIIEIHTALVNYVAERPAATVAIYAAVYVAAVVFSVPGGSLLTVVGGIVFGGALGGLITTITVTLGSVCVFLIARTALSGWMRRRADKMEPRIASFIEGLRNNAFYVIVVLRLVPVVPFWASNALPALFGVGIWVFTGATLVGLLPWTMSYAFFGSALGEIVIAQEIANPGCVAAGTCPLDFSTLILGPVITGIVIALLALVPVGTHWWWSRRRKRAEGGTIASSPEV